MVGHDNSAFLEEIENNVWRKKEREREKRFTGRTLEEGATRNFQANLLPYFLIATNYPFLAEVVILILCQIPCM